jgi:MoaA/NifB/PqqE/SkfB family radical SAM enzyme
MNLSILYRGPLASCNYGCPYCPFAKHTETRAEHRADEGALNRFLGWVEDQREKHTLSVFFTPWGEALIHRRYQQAFAHLTHLPHIQKVTIQTNLSCRLGWVEACDKSRMALWTTFHPGEVSRERFLARCLELMERGVAFSVGVVGLREHLDAIEWLRAALPHEIYVWVNAYKRIPDYYTPDDLRRLEQVDALFPLNNVRHASRGKACRTGESVFSVDGEGVMRRCHFVREPIGNIYTPHWEAALQPRTCTNETCGCHIGYVHMPGLELDAVFGKGILERIPQISLNAVETT